MDLGRCPGLSILQVIRWLEQPELEYRKAHIAEHQKPKNLRNFTVVKLQHQDDKCI